MAVPMYLLYEGGLVLARILQKMRREASEQEEAEA
jgi:Sec-independent protein secretion pathway component TatC